MKQIRRKFVVPLLLVTVVAWLFRDPLRNAIGLLAAGLATDLAVAAPLSHGGFHWFNVANATVPTHEILAGGPGRDGIPAIEKPKFIRPSAVNFLRDDDLVVSVTFDGKIRAYPLRILVWHEIVNDELSRQAIAVTYCPLCGTAMVFNRDIAGRRLTFGVSGLLYQSDVLMYDRQTESLWSQLAMQSVAGPQAGTGLEWLPSEHLTWGAWKAKHPQGEVLSTDTGSRRDYSTAHYAHYEQSPDTMFPVRSYRTELSNKEWVIGVLVDGAAHAYVIRCLPGNQIVLDEVNNTVLELTYDPASQQAVVRRRESGETLPHVKVYWFAWQAFYPQTTLWKSK